MRYFVYLLFGLACAAAGFAAKAALENDEIAQLIRDYGLWIGMVALAGIILLGAMLGAAYLYVIHRARKLLNADTPMTEAQIAEGLVDLLISPEGVTNPTSQDRQRAALVNVGAWLMRRQATQFYFTVTVTVMGGLIGTATLFLLYEQNQKIDLQTTKITLQTDANIAQSVLLEGTRRAALNSDLSNMLEMIRTAPKKNKGVRCDIAEPGAPPTTRQNCWVEEKGTYIKYYFSRDTRFEIQSFLRRSTPYRLAVSSVDQMEFDKPLRSQFDFPLLSPERGRVFEALVQNRVDAKFFNFSSAQLTDADLARRYLPATHLTGADLRRADLSQSDLEYSNLSWVDLRDANLAATIFKDANLTGAKLGGADLFRANFSGATLRQVDLSGLNLSGVDMTGIVIDAKTSFDGAWAWAEDPPVGLPSSNVALCAYDASAMVLEQFQISSKPC